MIGYEDALAVVQRLVEASDESSLPSGTPLVLVGGTAMAAWHVRAQSRDVDLYIPSFDDDVVQAVEEELRQVYGPNFRLDVTRGENLWGSILLRDIVSSPEVGRVDVGARTYPLRALRIEDLFLVKLASGRLQDLEDLPLLAARSTSEALVARFNELIAWHGDRRAIMGYADCFVAQLVHLLGCEPIPLIQALQLPEYVRVALREAHAPGPEGGE